MLVIFPATGPSSWCVLLQKDCRSWIRMRHLRLWLWHLSLSLGWLYCCLKFHCISCVNGFLSFMVTISRSIGWRSSESTHLPSMWPGFKSLRWCHMWVEFVVGSLLCSERFLSGYSGFPFFSKINISKFQFDQESGRRRMTLWMCYFQIIIYVFIKAVFSLGI